MTNLIATFQDRFSDWLTALSQHLQLSLLTLLLAIFIAIPLAVYLRYHEKLADWILQIAGIFQTIPSSGLVGTLYPLDGNWNLASFDSSSDLCDFSDFAKYHHWAKGN